MKRNKIFSVVACLLIVLSGFCLFGCKDKSEKEEKAIAVIDGFSIESIEVFHVRDNDYNISIGIKNTNEESATFDFTQIHLIYEGHELEHNGNDVLFEIGKYEKVSFQIIVGDSNLAVGDSVDVYYQEELLKTVVVTEF